MEYEPLKKSKKSFNLKILLIILTIIMFSGVSFSAAFYVYNYNDQRGNTIQSGLISLNFTNDTADINMKNAVPMTDEVGMENTPYEFTVENTSPVPINVSCELEINKEKTTIPLSAVRYAFFIGSDLIKKGNVSELQDDIIYVLENFKSGDKFTGKLIFWIDYYYDKPKETFSAQIKVTGQNSYTFYDFANNMRMQIVNAGCSSSVEGDDGVVYLSGNNSCVDFNYVSYSDKLWRITSINADGTVKMVTDDVVTEMSYEKDEDNNVAIDKWLNDDFKKTLNNYDNLVVENTLGLLKENDYLKASENATEDTNYLNIERDWWLFTGPDATVGNSVSATGRFVNTNPLNSSFGVRPSLVLKTEASINAGDGTKENPYKILDDK